MYANIFAQSKGSAIADESLLRHMIVNSLRKIKEKFGNDYGRMVLCLDSSNAWRNEHFEYYKHERKAKRAESPSEDMAEMFKFIHSIQDELINFSPYPCIKVPRAEADDIIAILSGEQNRVGGKTLICSNDHDFFQLHNDNTEQYLSLKGKVIRCEDPDQQLFELIVSGDKSDGIPNVLSDDDTFAVATKRQKPLRKGTAAQIIDDICKTESLMEQSGTVTKQIQRNWDRNERLIDLKCIPQDIRENILAAYKDATTAKYENNDRGIDFYKYMLSADMKIMADNTQSLMIGE